MKKLIHIRFVLLLLACCTLASCNKLVDVGAPTNAVVTSSVFSNDGTAITAQLGAYAEIETNLTYYELYTGLSSDELTSYATDQYNLDLYRNALNAQFDGGLDGIWHGLYFYVYEENSILENVLVSSGMSARVKQLMTGEAKFTRAWLYFQLVNMFGDVPLLTSTDYTVNSSLPRASKDSVYYQMVSDLQSAKGLLSDSYLDANDNPGAIDRVRPTTWAAHTLLARTYLYMGKYDLAAQEADTVIAHTSLFSLVSDLSQVFKMNSTEAIWQLSLQNGYYSTYDGNLFILTTPPSSVALSPQLQNAFEPNDSRWAKWINSYSENGKTWYYPYKYRDNGNATTASEDYMVLRLAELYLIRAEAKARQNDPGGAVADLNVIRHRANLPDYSGATDMASLLAAIMHERQVELFTEDHRWYDLKRTNTVDAVMSVVTPQKGGVWNSYQQLYPLDVSDLQYDPNLVQNAGY